MKHINNIISYVLILLVSVGITACREDVNEVGDGNLSLKMHIAKPQSSDNSSVSADNSDALADSCRIRIYGSKGLVRYYKGLNNLPTELWLASGDYRIAAYTGDSVAAMFNGGYYKGESNFSIKAGETTVSTLTCKVVNTLVTVALTDELKGVLADFQITIGTSAGSLTFTENYLDSVGYYILPEGETNLNWELTGTRTDNTTYTQSGTIPNVKAATKYDLTLDINESEYTLGGAYFQLTVNESAIEKVEDIVIYKRPDIVGNGFDMDEILTYEVGTGTDVSVWVNASSALYQLYISGDNLTAMGLPENEIELVSAATSTLSQWEAAGVSYRYEYNEAQDISTAKITLSQALIASLTEGVYEIEIHAKDMHSKEWRETLTINISNAVVLTEPAVRHEIWAKHATLRGTLLREADGALSFQYRKKGSDEWMSVSAELNGEDITADVTGLSSGTTYEYRVVSGSMPSSVINEFTTETEFVLPNAGFENWSKSGSVLLIHGSNEERWWDSGNHGSATLKVNVTTQDTGLKNSGNSSIKLKSQFVSLLGIGKFAAGNVFSGVYAGTDGTNGILDIGRPFSTRPAKLKGYIKYITGVVDYSETSELPKGSTDIGSLYIAVGDWDAPVHVTTKDKKVFNRDDEHIIGFGEIELHENTEGDGLIPFTIDVDYRSTTRIPTYIVIVASASYYGDYFTGSTASTMWLDDLELVYE